MSYSLSFVLNVVLLILVVFHFRRRVVTNQQLGRSAKNWFSLVYAAAAVLIASFGYELVALAYEFYGLSIDHGPDGIAYLASGVFNIMIGFVGIIVGRIIIGWRAID